MSGRRLRDECLVDGCHDEPFVGGRCEEHDVEEVARQRRSLLVSSLLRGDEVAICSELSDDIQRLRRRYREATLVATTSQPESREAQCADSAVALCRTMAEAIFDANERIAAGRRPDRGILLVGWDRLDELMGFGR